MKKIATKRIMLYDDKGNGIIDSVEYDGRLSDDNILGAFHTLGKTTYHNGELWTVKNNCLQYQVGVMTFYQYQKSWYNLLMDWIKRKIDW